MYKYRKLRPNWSVQKFFGEGKRGNVHDIASRLEFYKNLLYNVYVSTFEWNE